MAKGSVVRGTPINVVKNAGGGGIRAGKPEGMIGTVHKQFDSDRRGYQSHPDGGTPYHSQDGNPGDARRVVAHGTSLESSDHGNQNSPKSNGPTVLLDVHGPEDGFMPRENGGVMDSPVPEHASQFDARTMHQEDRAHLGKGLEHLAGDRVNNDLRRLDGVMSRGLDSTSHPDQDELELTRDDTLKPPEAGTQQDVQGHTSKLIHE